MLSHELAVDLETKIWMGIGHGIWATSKDVSGQVKSLLGSLGIKYSHSFIDGDDHVCYKSSLRKEEGLV